MIWYDLFDGICLILSFQHEKLSMQGGPHYANRSQRLNIKIWDLHGAAKSSIQRLRVTASGWKASSSNDVIKIVETRRKYEMEKYSSCSRMRWRNPPSCLTWKCKIQRWWKKSEFHTKLEIYHEENDVTHSLIAWSIRRQSIWAPFVPQDVKWERGAQWMAQRPNQWTTMYRHCQQRWTPGCVKPREQITQPRAYFLAISLPLLLREDGVFFAHTSCTFPMEKTDRKDRKEECKNHPQQHMCMHVPAAALSLIHTSHCANT